MVKFDRLYLYKSEEILVIIGSMRQEKINKIYWIDRSSPRVQITGLIPVYDYKEALKQAGRLLVHHSPGGGNTGVQQSLDRCFQFVFLGLLGFLRFTDCEYLVAITKGEVVARMGTREISQVRETRKVMVQNRGSCKYFQSGQVESLENQYLSLLDSYGLDNHVYFSHSLELTVSIQKQLESDQQRTLQAFRGE